MLPCLGMPKAAASKDLLREVFRAYGRMGGKARAAKLTPERRQEIARQGGQAAKTARQRKTAVA